MRPGVTDVTSSPAAEVCRIRDTMLAALSGPACICFGANVFQILLHAIEEGARAGGAPNDIARHRFGGAPDRTMKQHASAYSSADHNRAGSERRKSYSGSQHENLPQRNASLLDSGPTTTHCNRIMRAVKFVNNCMSGKYCSKSSVREGA
jgi:hypothetical protein